MRLTEAAGMVLDAIVPETRERLIRARSCKQPTAPLRFPFPRVLARAGRATFPAPEDHADFQEVAAAFR